MGAIFDPLRCIGEMTSATLPQSIQWTVTEQAVKKLAFFLVAGEVFTIGIFEVRKIAFHGITPFPHIILKIQSMCQVVIHCYRMHMV